MATHRPLFWSSINLHSCLLLPASLLYWLTTKLRAIITLPYASSVPLICIGNCTVGGSGKTPVAIKVAQFYQSKNIHVAFISKGYKGSITEPTKVLGTHTPDEVGDEPYMLSKIAPTYIGKSRKKTVQLAEKSNAQILIMDDGLQNPTVTKSFSILVIDGDYGLGNNLIMPAGPLRETLHSANKKANIAIVIGSNGTIDNRTTKKITVPIFNAHFSPNENIDNQGKFIAFAGIGNPGKFFKTLKQHGFNLAEEISYPDHYKYGEQEISNLINQAQKQNYSLITTEKDYVKISTQYKSNIQCLKVDLTISNQQALTETLDKLCQVKNV